MMETDPTEEADKPETIGAVKSEWTQNFDDLLLETTSIKLKVRSTRRARKVRSG